MFAKFYPDTRMDSTYQIDFEALYQEGIRGVIFDIDNTLVPHGADANEQSIALFTRLRKLGMECCLLSNNDEERVSRFNRKIGVHAIHKAGKPMKKNYYCAMEKMGTTLEHTLFVGDQLFTDVYGAKRIGMRNILTKPIDKKEEIQIVLKRRLEFLVLREYDRKMAH